MLNQKLTGAASATNYIEDVFSTYLYTGNGSTQTITNNIDLSTKGGLVWTKARSTANTYSHKLFDTVRGANKWLSSADTDAQNSAATNFLTAFNTDGFAVSSTGNGTDSTNASGVTEVSWTFRKQPKFFDIVTYTGDGTSNRAVAHSLGSVPGCIMVKATSTTNSWSVYHRSLTSNQYSLVLNSTAAENYTNEFPTAPDSTSFYVRSGNNSNGVTYVAYVFAHDAGGFGLTGTDNVISCGSYTGTGATNNNITLGYEPQWLLIKESSAAGNDWVLVDTMRGLSETSQTFLYPNSSSADTATSNWVAPTSTGFRLLGTSGLLNGSGSTYIYIAIRRGPMKVPTDGTTVFKPVTATPSGSQGTYTTNFPTDLIITTERGHASTGQTFVSDRLRGTTTASRVYLNTAGTAAEVSGGAGGFGLDSNDSVFDNLYPGAGITNPVIYWNFQRAPSFFDEVCYTGTGSATTFNHNLGVAPELMIFKNRSTTSNWPVYDSTNGATGATQINTTNAWAANSVYFNNTTPTNAVFSVGTNVGTNGSGNGMIAYLFATCPGVSKVGSYTGNGSSQTINCGFTAGARFILIKRTDSTGDWYVWDTARGIVSGNDPHLSLNTTSAEVTTDDTIDSDSTGFVVNQLSATNVNVSSATYIYLAIA